MNIFVPSIEVASIDPQPNFPLEDVSRENTETFQYMLGVEQRARPDDGRLVSGSDRASQSNVYLQAMFGPAAVHRSEAIRVESIEFGSRLFDDMIERLTDRPVGELMVVSDDMDVITKSFAKMDLSERAANVLIADFRQTMPNATKVIDMAARDFDTKLATLGAVASRGIALSSSGATNINL